MQFSLALDCGVHYEHLPILDEHEVNPPLLHDAGDEGKIREDERSNISDRQCSQLLLRET